MFILRILSILMMGRLVFCIYGGTDGNEYVFEAFGAIKNRNGDEPLCGSALITNRHILTMSSCLQDWQSKIVQFGVKDWCKKDYVPEFLQWSSFSNVFFENNENPASALAIALLAVTIQKIVPMSPPPHEGLRGGESYGICGFGVFSELNLKSCSLRQAELMVIPHEACSSYSGLICSEPKINSYQAGSMCFGDQGGPLLMCENDGPNPTCYLAGIQWKTLDGSCTGTNLARCIQDPEASKWINNIIDYS